ncbi:MAG: hypothetical protein AAF720_03325 [Pseudomonadota bacterium]
MSHSLFGPFGRAKSATQNLMRFGNTDPSNGYASRPPKKAIAGFIDETSMIEPLTVMFLNSQPN